MKIIYTKNAPKAIGPYSQAIEANGFIFLSGQLGINPQTGELVDGIINQTQQAIINIGAILNESGLNYDNVIKTTCFLKNMTDFPVFNEIYEKHFTQKPSRSCVEAAALPKNALIEIEVIASK